MPFLTKCLQYISLNLQHVVEGVAWAEASPSSFQQIIKPSVTVKYKCSLTSCKVPLSMFISITICLPANSFLLTTSLLCPVKLLPQPGLSADLGHNVFKAGQSSQMTPHGHIPNS